MKSSIIVENMGNQIDTELQLTEFKRIWKEEGNKVKDLKDVKIYINIEQNKIYYVANESIEGCFDIVK